MENDTLNSLDNDKHKYNKDNLIHDSISNSINSINNPINDLIDDCIDDRIAGIKKVLLQFEKDKKDQLKVISTRTNTTEFNTFFDLQNKDFVFYSPTDLNSNESNNDKLEHDLDLQVENNNKEIEDDKIHSKIEKKQQFQEFKWNDVQNLDKKRKALEYLEEKSSVLELELQSKVKNTKNSKKDNKVSNSDNVNELKKPSIKTSLLSKSSNIIDDYNVPYHFLIIILMMSLIYVMYITVGLATSYLKLNS
jgi:hypothetical protein